MEFMLDPFDCNETLHGSVLQNFADNPCIDVLYRYSFTDILQKSLAGLFDILKRFELAV